MANETICKNRDMAMAIIRTITEGMKAGTQRAALESVAEWLQRNSFPKIPNSRKEREAIAQKINTEIRNGMSEEGRKAMAAFYLEGIN